MSSTEEQQAQSQSPDILVRSFATELTPGDGRTVDMRIVPYGETIAHNDGEEGDYGRRQYREQFAHGAFTHQLRAANRVLVNFEHEEGIRGVIGHGKALLERDDALYGSVKIHESPEGDKVLMLVREKVLGGVSIEFRPTQSVRTADGIIKRVKAHLSNIALTRFNAYEGAVILGLREEAVTLDEELLPVELDPDLLQRCQRLGIKLPERLQAHPAEGTPSDDGTPDDGTRQSTHNTGEEG